MTKDGLDLLTVVMHELGHLLGYDHSDDPDDLMAPVLSATQSRTAPRLALLDLSPDLSRSLPQASSPPNSLLSGSAGPASSKRSESAQPQEQPSRLGDAAELFAALAFDDDRETGRTRISQRSRIERYERELDAWFAALGEEIPEVR